ncbi:MAG: hypothetical protein HY785_06835 [Oscillatoriophycideae cyanobacterium NC_groundwater_1537_Pr4_S-0.65um_50_18]|nr:hypothetical protein [Oscillatoriophycideae cyanobacterium NC_groundwater_1537_Pr4_S-0.65um_50_18]
MTQALHNPQRYRGFVLTRAGLQKLRERVKQLETQTRLRQSPRTIAERVQLSEPNGIHPITVRKILNGVHGVDKRSIQLVFHVLQLQLDDGDCAHAGLYQRGVEAQAAPTELPAESPAESPIESPAELPLEPSLESSETGIERTLETALPKRQEWSEVLDGARLYGRVEESAQLRQAIVTEHCRLVKILGMAGSGKTALATLLAKQMQPEFEVVIWKSLNHAPALQTVVSSMLQSLMQQTGEKIELPAHLEELTGLLIEKLQNYRCLIVFDHFNSILSGEQYAGYCRPGYEGYGELLKVVAEVSHQSCLIITSREKPRAIGLTAGNYVRSLQLDGLSVSDCQQMLKTCDHLIGSTDHWQSLVDQYNGNPLILKIVAIHIQHYFDGHISDYLKSLKDGQFLFNNLRELLSQQFDRLSHLERELAYHLARYHQPVAVSRLRDEIASLMNPQGLLEGLDSLSRRSFLHRQGTYITLDRMIHLYVNECLSEQQDTFLSKSSLSKSKLKIVFNQHTTA